MKPLLPTLREKARYISFSVEGGRFDFESVKKGISNRLMEILGTLELAKSDFRLVGNCWESNKGIIACNSKGLERIKGALSLVNRINGKTACIRVIKVSGTIKKCK